MKISRALISNVCVLGTLALLAFWGHETDWTFSVDFKHRSAHHQEELHNEETRIHRNEVIVEGSMRDFQEIGVELGEVTERYMEETITAPGVVTYVQTHLAQLSARAPGTVWRVNCQVGDKVRHGDILAILDAVEVGTAKADFLQSMVLAELREETLARLKSAEGAVAGRQIRETESMLREAKVARYNAMQKLINLGFSVSLDDYLQLDDNQRGAKLHFLGLPESVTKSLDPNSTSANLIPVVAPFDGVIIRQDIVKGEVVSPEHSQLVIADVDRMWVRLNVSKEDSLRVNVGQALRFSADGLPGAIESRVSLISTEVDEKTKTLTVFAEVDNSDQRGGVSTEQRRLKANMFGIGSIRVRESGMALVVPTHAIHWDGKDHILLVAEKCADTRIEFRPRVVKLGSTSNGVTEILEGVPLNTKIAIAGSHLLKSEWIQRQSSNDPQ